MVDVSTPPPRVSVIIIFLNEARFLAETVESVRAQSFADWELILVDDGSTDGSSEMARGFADGERIRYLEHPCHANRGMSASRNAGLAAARGEFIAFLDADDIWPAEKLAEQVALFDAAPETDMVYGRAWIWHSWDPTSRTKDYFYDLGVPPGKLYAPGELLPLLIRNRAQTPMSGNAIMRRALAERVGGFEETFRGMFEDQAFFAKTHLVSRCHVDDRFWLFYRQHGASCTAQSAGSLKDLTARGRFLRWLAAYLRRSGAYGAAVRWAMLRAWLSLGVGVAHLSARRLLGRA
ncbi:MAG: glycosyltransferase family 2 protein [Sphingomonadales bacterium]|nr:glycosyltransferase family 2 protein [Sphingomonadales bacterium]